MKTIQVSNKDYETLMQLSKELQTQKNDYQAFPYFWSPRSTKFGIGTSDDEKTFYKDDSVDTAEELFTDDLKERFLQEEKMGAETQFKNIDLYLWEDFLEKNGYAVNYRREEKIEENNFSLFKNDVKLHIQNNKHHLGKNPHTYAHTIFRMYKMEELIKCLYRLNPQPEKDTNNEAFYYRNK